MTRFYNVLAALSVVLTPVAMIAALGWSVYAAVLAMTGAAWLAIVSGLATAAALETVGIVAGETALWFHGRADRRWLPAAAVLVVYVVVGIVALRGTPLGLLPLMAGAVYVLVGLRAQAQRETVLDIARAARSEEWQHEQWRIEQADATAVKLARLQVQAASKQPASGVLVSANGHTPAASGSMYQCKHCASTFASMQALGGHVRAAHGKTA